MTAVQEIKINVPKSFAKPHPVKVTALEYLREALAEERYEDMQELTDIAKEFGATHWEIRTALTRNFKRALLN